MGGVGGGGVGVGGGQWGGVHFNKAKSHCSRSLIACKESDKLSGNWSWIVCQVSEKVVWGAFVIAGQSLD